MTSSEYSFFFIFFPSRLPNKEGLSRCAILMETEPEKTWLALVSIKLFYKVGREKKNRRVKEKAMIWDAGHQP